MDPLTIAALVALVGGTSLSIYKDKRQKDQQKQIYHKQREELNKKIGRVDAMRSTATGHSASRQAAKGRSGGIKRRRQELVRRPYDWQIEDINTAKSFLKKGQPSRNMQYLDYGIQGLAALSGAAGGLSALSTRDTGDTYGQSNIAPNDYGVPSAEYQPQGQQPSAAAPGRSTADYYRMLYGTGVQRMY